MKTLEEKKADFLRSRGKPDGIGKPPSATTVVRNFFSALMRNGFNRFRLVDQNTTAKRLEICRGCILWEEGARFGLGRCNHPSCGCSKGKLYLEAEKCPKKLW